MKMKFGAIIVDGRGKIGGHVASKNRSGAYLRTKVTPVNAQTGYQLSVRNRFTSLAQAWRGLTQEQRDAWNGAVSDFQKTDIFGDLRTPTGFSLYQRLNNNILLIGESAISTPPLPSEVGEVVATELEAESGTQSLSLTLADDVPAGTNVKVFATAPQSAGRSFVKSEYRLIGVLDPEATTPVDLLSDYQAKFGSTGEAGQKIFVKVQAVNATTGQTGTPSGVSDVVEASV
jgi:hypothetical protein